jgi:hypothetical protein
MKKYKIWLDPKTYVIVNEHQLYKQRWLDYFGGLDGVEMFIKNYKD